FAFGPGFRRLYVSPRRRIGIITKDSDFVGFLELHGPPPQVLWITLGNTSNTNLKDVLSKVFERALKLFAAGEPLVEIGEVS
ncbi:MAG: hypothetical protein NZN28_14515, partial [Meiothermus sp.]|uniref:DUF5615 family PIN-like protein n=1 Tax=Meiothermus sp. TaxID=1955249 RepID=UPI0025D4AF7F